MSVKVWHVTGLAMVVVAAIFYLAPIVARVVLGLSAAVGLVLVVAGFVIEAMTGEPLDIVLARAGDTERSEP